MKCHLCDARARGFAPGDAVRDVGDADGGRARTPARGGVRDLARDGQGEAREEGRAGG